MRTRLQGACLYGAGRQAGRQAQAGLCGIEVISCKEQLVGPLLR